MKSAQYWYEKGVKHYERGHRLSNIGKRTNEKLEEIIGKLFGVTDSDSDKDVLKKIVKCMGGATVGYYALVVPHELSHIFAAELLRVKYKVGFDFSALTQPSHLVSIMHESTVIQGACINLAGPISEIAIGSWLFKKGIKEGNSLYTGFGLAGLVRTPLFTIFTQYPDIYNTATRLLGDSSALPVALVLGLTYAAGCGIYKGLDKMKSYVKEKISR